MPSISFLNVDEIDWVEAADDSVQLHASGTAHLVHGIRAKLEARLAAAQFLRVHRSTLVNSGRTYRERLDRLGDELVLSAPSSRFSGGPGRSEPPPDGPEKGSK